LDNHNPNAKVKHQKHHFKEPNLKCLYRELRLRVQINFNQCADCTIGLTEYLFSLNWRTVS